MIDEVDINQSDVEKCVTSILSEMITTVEVKQTISNERDSKIWISVELSSTTASLSPEHGISELVSKCSNCQPLTGSAEWTIKQQVPENRDTEENVELNLTSDKSNNGFQAKGLAGSCWERDRLFELSEDFTRNPNVAHDQIFLHAWPDSTTIEDGNADSKAFSFPPLSCPHFCVNETSFPSVSSIKSTYRDDTFISSRKGSKPYQFDLVQAQDLDSENVKYRQSLTRETNPLFNNALEKTHERAVAHCFLACKTESLIDSQVGNKSPEQKERNTSEFDLESNQHTEKKENTNSPFLHDGVKSFKQKEENSIKEYDYRGIMTLEQKEQISAKECDLSGIKSLEQKEEISAKECDLSGIKSLEQKEEISAKECDLSGIKSLEQKKEISAKECDLSGIKSLEQKKEISAKECDLSGIKSLEQKKEISAKECDLSGIKSLEQKEETNDKEYELSGITSQEPKEENRTKECDRFGMKFQEQNIGSNAKDCFQNGIQYLEQTTEMNSNEFLHDSIKVLEQEEEKNANKCRQNVIKSVEQKEAKSANSLKEENNAGQSDKDENSSLGQKKENNGDEINQIVDRSLEQKEEKNTNQFIFDHAEADVTPEPGLPEITADSKAWGNFGENVHKSKPAENVFLQKDTDEERVLIHDLKSGVIFKEKSCCFQIESGDSDKNNDDTPPCHADTFETETLKRNDAVISRANNFEPEICNDVIMSRQNTFEPEIYNDVIMSRQNTFEPEICNDVIMSRQSTFEPEICNDVIMSRQNSFEPEILTPTSLNSASCKKCEVSEVSSAKIVAKPQASLFIGNRNVEDGEAVSSVENNECSNMAFKRCNYVNDSALVSNLINSNEPSHIQPRPEYDCEDNATTTLHGNVRRRSVSNERKAFDSRIKEAIANENCDDRIRMDVDDAVNGGIDLIRESRKSAKGREVENMVNEKMAGGALPDIDSLSVTDDLTTIVRGSDQNAFGVYRTGCLLEERVQQPLPFFPGQETVPLNQVASHTYTKAATLQLKDMASACQVEKHVKTDVLCCVQMAKQLDSFQRSDVIVSNQDPDKKTDLGSCIVVHSTGLHQLEVNAPPLKTAKSKVTAGSTEDHVVPNEITDCEENLNQHDSEECCLYGDVQELHPTEGKHSPTFKWKYTPSVDDIYERLPQPTEDEIPDLGPIQPLLTGTSGRRLRIGLSRRQKVKRLHKI